MENSKLVELKTLSSLYRLREEVMGTSLEDEKVQHAYKQIFSCLDITTLDGNDTPAKVRKLCEKALSYRLSDGEPLLPASVCVFPSLVFAAREVLEGTTVKTAAVSGGFPYGQTPLSVKLSETTYALDKGADEIDFIVGRSSFLEGKTDDFIHEIQTVKALCGNKVLKVILETGALETLSKVREAVGLAIAAGADFVKTSTGKIPQGATPEDVIIMLDEIVHRNKENQCRTGIKISGGVSEPHQSLVYYRLFQHFFPQIPFSKNMFRIGCSRLSDKLFRAILLNNGK